MLDTADTRRGYARTIREEIVAAERPRALLMGIELEVVSIGIYLLQMGPHGPYYAAKPSPQPTRALRPWLVESLSQRVLRKEVDSLYKAMTGSKAVLEEEA
jgi:hypothetical protein